MLFYVSGEMLTGVPRALLITCIYDLAKVCKMDGRTTFVIMLVIIMSWLVMVQNAPVDRNVLTCYWPDCREVRVNVTEIREVFVTSCRLNRVVVFGDPTVIKIRDLHGHICGKYKLCIFTQNLKAYKLDFDCNLPLLFFGNSK